MSEVGGMRQEHKGVEGKGRYETLLDTFSCNGPCRRLESNQQSPSIDGEAPKLWLPPTCVTLFLACFLLLQSCPVFRLLSIRVARYAELSTEDMVCRYVFSE